MNFVEKGTIVVLMTLHASALSQQSISNAPPRSNDILPLPFLQDTTRASDTLQPVVLRKPSRAASSERGYESTKSPGLAVLFSAALPGAGQLYNESYWKVPVIWGLGGYWVYEWIDLNKKYKDFQDQFQKSINTLPPYGDTQLQRVRDFYRDERDKFAWYLGALYVVNLLDAYVTANLYDFSVSPDLGADGRVVPKITASVRIPLR